MIIKEADDKKPAIRDLQALLSRPDCKADARKRVEQEIRNIQAGARGEEEAAYEMRVHWGESKNWMAINDLRIEHGGLVAQIDHLLINRFLEMWVCESKHFSEGIGINEHGEFAAFFGGKPYGVPSPIEQNAKHILILRKLFDSGAVKLPTRLGFTIKPDLKSLVLVSKGARISRPKTKIDGIDAIIKNDQVFKFIDKVIDQSNNPLLMAKIIGQDTLEALARDIAKLHKPITFDWVARFGLPKEPPAVPAAKPEPTPEPPKAAAAPTTTEIAQPAAEPEQKPKQKLVCHSCGASVTYNVAKFCWLNRPKFGGNIYCMDCQKTVSVA
ncbi:MAG: nuclease [Nitrosomonadales bacterium]|nr:MAG: nuclease [Nitrosomonadales bacterium]